MTRGGSESPISISKKSYFSVDFKNLKFVLIEKAGHSVVLGKSMIAIRLNENRRLQLYPLHPL